MQVVGIDNDMRSRFFGDAASTRWQRGRLEQELAARYRHVEIDIRDNDAIERLFQRYGWQISLVVHTAAQPSHDWAAKEPHTDFSVNALGTLNCSRPPSIRPRRGVHLHFHQQGLRRHAEPTAIGGARDALGDRAAPRIPRGHPEEMSIDQTLHSLFGASKVAADVLVQEYGRYFGMRTA